MIEDRERDAFWENAWSGVERTVATLVGAGIADLGRIVEVLDQHRDLGPLEPVQERLAAQLGLPRDSGGRPLFRLAVAYGRYVLLPRAIADRFLMAVVADLIDDQTEYVVELGCGWGRNLFQTHLRLPQRRLRYVAAEPTESGRRAARLVAGLDRSLALDAVPFDYRRPDFSFLPAGANVVVMTCHSIEQVAVVGEGLFDALLRRSGTCRGAHLEPVGWQREPDLRSLVAEGPPAGAGGALRLEDEALLRNAAIWAAERGYNTDFLAVIDRLGETGRLNVRQRVFDCFGENPFNPSTLLVWEKR